MPEEIKQAPDPGPEEERREQGVLFPLGGEETPLPLPPSPEIPRHKPLLARLLNALRIPTNSGVDWALDWFQVILIAGLLAWGTMSFGMVRMRVPTGSMIPTIQEGDSFFVDKFSFLLGLKHPEPGDIIVFWHTEGGRMCRSGFQLGPWELRWGNPEPCRERYVKRLIAVGGQSVAIRQGKIYIDGQPLTDFAFSRDYVCNNAEATTPPANRSAAGCSWDVPPGQFFVLGDNTTNSSDSRYWGFAQEQDFIGEPFLRVWPLNRSGFMNGYFGNQP